MQPYLCVLICLIWCILNLNLSFRAPPEGGYPPHGFGYIAFFVFDLLYLLVILNLNLNLNLNLSLNQNKCGRLNCQGVGD
jgi:hypothetical protein